MDETQATTPEAEMTFRMRLRFRVQRKLNIDTGERRVEVAGREVLLSSAVKDTPIRESEWLVMNARGFASEAEAREFGHKLKAALSLSSVATRIGVDAGTDLATSALGKDFQEQIERRTGAVIRSNIHGLDVFADTPNTKIISFQAAGSVLVGADDFLRGLSEHHSLAASASQRVQDVILLLNYALMRPEPVTQIVFAVSAVEMLGQTQTWSPAQKLLLGELAQAVQQSAIGTDTERREVTEAIAKLHRLSLRQGVFRLLDSLGLARLKKGWDALYAERSTLVHGLAPKPGADYNDLAFRTVSLCGQILLTAIAAEVPGANRHAADMYIV